jgi:hypothetical protein
MPPVAFPDATMYPMDDEDLEFRAEGEVIAGSPGFPILNAAP